MYFIVSKIEHINDSVKYTPIGYLLDENKANLINNKYEITFGDFVKKNKNKLENNSVRAIEFFNSNIVSYSANQKTTSVVGMGLSELTNIENLI